MRGKIFPVAALIFFLLAYVVIFPSYQESRKKIRMEEIKGLTLPPHIVKLLSLEFTSIAADLLFVRVSQFYGGKIEKLEEATKEDWEWFHRNLDLITELDPYFQDPYYIGNAFLTWDAGMYNEANDLLQKATDARQWDWIFPFFIGFNKFYFLGDNKGGAEYLLIASKRPGAYGFLPNLASRLHYEDKQTQTAIDLLNKMAEKEKDENIKQMYKVRLEALKRIAFLEAAVDFYKYRIGVTPRSLNVLIDSMIIKSIPPDPYGGKFYIDDSGDIKSTSKLAFIKK